MFGIKNILFLLILSVIINYNSSSQIYIIANKSVANEQLTKAKIIEIYTLNKLYWENGEKIKVIDYKEDNKIKEDFYKFLGIDYKEIQKIWLRKQFSGKAMPPETFKNEDEILQEVEKNKGAIAYVDKVPDNKSIIVLAKIDINIVKKDE